MKAGFIEPMLLLRIDQLPDDAARWSYQLKLDGYRAVAFKTGGVVHLRSRNDNDFGGRYPTVVRGLAKLPHVSENREGQVDEVSNRDRSNDTHPVWAYRCEPDRRGAGASGPRRISRLQEETAEHHGI